MDELTDETTSSEQVFDLAGLTSTLALMLDGLRVLAETGGGYRANLIERGFSEPIADAVAGDWVRQVQHRLFFGGAAE